MNSNSNTTALSADLEDPRLGPAVEEYRTLLSKGERPDRQAFLAKHADIADALDEYLEALDVLQAAVPQLAPNNTDAPAHDVGTGVRPGTPLGDYQIVREVGRGGMGIVYEAEQLSLGRRVALKVMPFAATLDARQLQRFKNEAQAAAQLHHQHIVPVYHVGYERGVHYYAMQFIDGQTIAAMIQELRRLAGLEPPHEQEAPSAASALAGDLLSGRGVARPEQGEGRARAPQPIPPVPAHTGVAASTERSTRSPAFFRTVASLGQQAAEALEHAHQMGVVHRDVKPANLIVDGRGHLWVTDFGLAQFQGNTKLTLSGDLLGTLRYMSPEQALARQVPLDHRTDIYSLGATLYELLTLHAAFAGSDRQELLRRIAFEEPNAPRQFNKAIPDELETIVLKAMSKEPEHRYATAQALADDLRHFLEDKPITARRPTVWQRVRKWSRRHKPVVVTAALAGVALLVTAVVALAVSNVLITHERNEKAAAASAEKEARQEAMAREAETLAILEFVENKIFAAARPEGQEGGLGPDVTLRQAIEEALPFVDRRFRNQPVIEARLRMTLGQSFSYLGEPEKAAEQYKRARALLLQHRGPEHRDTLLSMHNLATSYYDLGRYADALQLREEVLAAQTTRLGADHVDTLMSMNNLANSYFHAGKRGEALILREKTLALMRANLGPDHPDTLRSMNNLAISYSALNRHGDVLRLHEETLALRRVKLGPDHPDTLSSLSNVARAHVDAGRYAEALKLQQEILAVRKAKLGPDHPNTLRSMGDIAATYEALGRYGDALTLHQETLELRKAKLGPEHPHTFRSMMGLANAYSRLGRHADALKLNEETLALRKTKLGPHHADTLKSMHNLANSYVALGRHADALGLQKETLALMKANLGPQHADTLRSMSSLANCYHDLGRRTEALTLHQETLALMQAKLGPDHPLTLSTMNNLANSLTALGRHADAIKFYEQALTLQETKLGPGHGDTLASMYNLARILTTCPDAMLRDPGRAVVLASKALELAPRQRSFLILLGLAHYRAGNWKAVIEALEKPLQLGKAPNSAAAFFLAMAHWQLGDKEQARKRYEQAVAWMEKHKPQDPELKRFRAEAEELLGIKKNESK